MVPSGYSAPQSAAVINRVPDGCKPKDLLGIPWMVAFALRADGWYLRQDIIWQKVNPMPESVRDRCTKAHEYLFLLSKLPRYYFDADAIREPHKRLWDSSNGGNLSPEGDHKANGAIRERGGEYPVPNPLGANKRSVWTVTPAPYPGAHFAVMPAELVRPCVLAGTSERGCCPACGAPWVRVVERPGQVRRLATVGANERRDKDRPNGADLARYRRENPPRDLGWAPSCGCPNHDPVGCVVLDPFAGSGTTLAVAVEERRRAVGIELNPEYHALIRKRLRGTTPALV